MSLREWLGFKPRMQDLATRLLAEFSRQGGRGWVFDVEQGVLRNDSGAVINLGNIYLEYSQSPRSGRADLLRKYSKMAHLADLKIPQLWELAAKNIFAVVRSRFDQSAIGIEARARAQPWPSAMVWPWIGDLQLRLVYDWGDHLAHVNQEAVETWGQTHTAVKERAIGNLRALTSPTWEAIGNGVHQLRSSVSYEESFLLVDRVLDRLPFKDSLVCIPINRGVLLAADAKSEPAMLAMLDEALRCLQEKPWPLSATLCARIDGEWCEFQPQGEVASRAGDLDRISLAITYESQKSALEQLHEHAGLDIFVATFGLIRREVDGNALRSWCTWSQGVRSMLPKSDFVVFGRDESQGAGDPVILTWDRALALCGRHLKATEEDPPRFVVDSFPDATEWAAITAAGEPLSA